MLSSKQQQQQQQASNSLTSHVSMDNSIEESSQGLNNSNLDRSTNSTTKNDLNISTNSNNNTGGGGNGKMYHGYIAVLKEMFGFIETLKHDEEVFFHFSNFVGNPMSLELGHEVEYTLSKRNGSNSGNCLPAENVKILPKGTIPQPQVLDTIYNGKVVRPLRCINPDQQQYSGLIECINEEGDTMSTHELGITSLTNKRDLLQKGDFVVFKVDEANRAAEVTAIRQKKRANVDSIKGQFGFLDFEVEEGKKLFFHMSEVQGNSNNLFSGDCVEFSVVTNQVSKVRLRENYISILFFFMKWTQI